MNVEMNAVDLPVLHEADVVVIGGSFGGIAAALALSRAGRRVALVEPRTYLGREITATLRPWLPSRPDLPVLLSSCLSACGKPGDGPEIPLQMDLLKLHLEDLLIDANVTLIYASLPVALNVRQGRLAGIVIGNKSGRQIIASRSIIDASETAVTARLCGQAFEAPSAPVTYRYTVEFDQVSPAIDHEYPPYATHLLNGQSFVVHPGYRDQQVWIECFMTLLPIGSTGFGLTKHEIAARHAGLRFAGALMAATPSLESAYLSATSYESSGPHTPCLSHDTTPEWAISWGSVRLGDVPLARFAGSVAGLWFLNEAVRLDPTQPDALCDPAYAAQLGDQLGSFVAEHAPAPPITASMPSRRREANDVLPLQVREPSSPQRGRPFRRLLVEPYLAPVVREADVLVVGGGSSGASAAIAAAREGMRTVLVDMNPGLGGTGTFGGVHSYWFGRRVGFSAQVMDWVAESHRSLHQPEPKGELVRWNIEAKSYALSKQAEVSGVEMLLNCTIIAVVMEQNRVKGVIAATRTGVVALLAQVIIDASGDGDLAVYAGAEFAYGSARDHSVMWYSLAQFTRPGLTRNNFTSTVDVGNTLDYTRAILAGRRRGGKANTYDHGIYVATRESRHIIGDVVLTLTDQLRHRQWPDVVNIAFSNHDVKGQTGSDWLRVGLIPPNLEIEIPLRALLPRNLENVLVVGKAISADHDALPAVRMQPDLENLGGIAALAAAQAVREQVSPRHISIRSLQQRLVGEGLLPRTVLDRQLIPRRYTPEQLQRMIEAVKHDRPLYAYSDMGMSEIFRAAIPFVELSSLGPDAKAPAESAFDQSAGSEQLNLARVLALVGSTKAVSTLVSAIENQLQAESLPVRDTHIRHVNLPPDQNAMPDVVYLLYTLGMLPDARALSIWQRIVDRLASVTEADFLDGLKGLFYYVDAVCFGAERLATPEVIPIIQQLHRYAPFNGKACDHGFQADFLQERLAYLELCMGRALARSGSPEGFVVLISYLNDARALLAEHAHSELVSITGHDFGKQINDWSAWLEGSADQLPCVAWSEPTDAIRAWDEIILESAPRVL